MWTDSPVIDRSLSDFMSDAAAREDAAWVTIETPFETNELKSFLADIERLFRINSLLEFERWQPTGPDSYIFKARNLSNDKYVDTSLNVVELPEGLRIHYSQGLKRSTILRVMPGDQGARLEIVDDYSGTPEEQRQARLDEVDRSLVTWGRDLHVYMKHWKRWSWFVPWRWYMTRIWQSMKPSARRISGWIVWITIAELVGFFMVFTIFWLEMQ